MNTDTGERLRSLYEPANGVAHVFSSKVADYVASRPDYPAPVYDAIRLGAKLRTGAIIADVASGTGLFARGLLQRGYSVIAVEPSTTMRSAADHFLGAFSHYRSVEGYAEALPLDPSSIDLITVAQAFHWFRADLAKTEFLRVLRPGGSVALIWNDRVATDPLHIALNRLFAEFGGAKRAALAAHERGDVSTFFGAMALTELSWSHQHLLDEAALQSLVFSRSYMPDRVSPLGRDAAAAVHRLFIDFAAGDHVNVRYTTVALFGQLQ